MKQVAIVGGGLAGMTAALSLLEQKGSPYEVTIYEQSGRLGGKAGADHVKGTYEDHGFHIYPAWYLNLYWILEKLNLRESLIDITKFHQLWAGEYPDFRALHNFTSFRYALVNLFSGSSPFFNLFLYYYSVADLLSQPYSRRAFLDQISINGFVRSRFYRTERVAKQYQDLLLKFISVPSYRVSTMTTQIMLNYWVKNSMPMHRILVGNMHEYFIAPWERRLRELGCKIEFGKELMEVEGEGGAVTHLRFSGTRGKPSWEEVEPDQVILAIPSRNLKPILRDVFYEVAPDLLKVHQLRHEPMSSLNLYFDRRLSSIPAEHINLMESKFALTFIDVSAHWKDQEGTVINLIASDTTQLRSVSDERAVKAIIAELERFLPCIADATITKYYYQPHIEEPLVTNDVGAWRFRPKAETGFSNLFVAGAHCRNLIDMTSMEGATVTGLNAANALMEHTGQGVRVPVHKPKKFPRALFVAARWLLLPFAALAKLGASIFEPDE